MSAISKICCHWKNSSRVGFHILFICVVIWRSFANSESKEYFIVISSLLVTFQATWFLTLQSSLLSVPNGTHRDSFLYDIQKKKVMLKIVESNLRISVTLRASHYLFLNMIIDMIIHFLILLLDFYSHKLW